MNGHSLPKKARTDMSSNVTVVLGAQWGDEGKGKVVDMLACNVDIVCRCQVSMTINFLLRTHLPAFKPYIIKTAFYRSKLTFMFL